MVSTVISREPPEILGDSEHNILLGNTATVTTHAKSLSKMLRIVENERFTVEIDSVNAIID